MMHLLTLYFPNLTLLICGNAYCRSAFLSAINEDNDGMIKCKMVKNRTPLSFIPMPCCFGRWSGRFQPFINSSLTFSKNHLNLESECQVLLVSMCVCVWICSCLSVWCSFKKLGLKTHTHVCLYVVFCLGCNQRELDPFMNMNPSSFSFLPIVPFKWHV